MPPTADERLVGVRAKIERAKQHVRDLEIAIQAFLDTGAYEVGSEKHPYRGNPIYKVIRADDPPASLSLIAGDAIHNLRSALDHLAWQLVLANGRAPTRRTAFPIYESAERYMTKDQRVIEGISAEAVEFINATKPYQGGNDPLWMLHELNNIDKHRLLLMVAATTRGARVLHGTGEQVCDFMGVTDPGARQYLSKYDHVELFVGDREPSCPLKPGDILCDRQLSRDPNEQLEFTLLVAFGEPEIAKGEPLLETLHQLSHLIDSIVGQFAPFL
jgi:hypothetical protein